MVNLETVTGIGRNTVQVSLGDTSHRVGRRDNKNVDLRCLRFLWCWYYVTSLISYILGRLYFYDTYTIMEQWLITDSNNAFSFETVSSRIWLLCQHCLWLQGLSLLYNFASVTCDRLQVITMIYLVLVAKYYVVFV